MGNIKNNFASLLSLFLLEGKKGDEFCIAYRDRDVTARATYYKRKVQTSRVVVIEGTTLKPVAVPMTKVILLDDPGDIVKPVVISTPGQLKQIINLKNINHENR